MSAQSEFRLPRSSFSSNNNHHHTRFRERNPSIDFQPEPVNGTMRSNMFGYAGAPMPLPRLRPPGTSTISHAFRTPESSTSEEEDRTDLLGRSFQTSSRPKSRSSLAVSIYSSIIYKRILFVVYNIYVPLTTRVNITWYMQ